MRARTSQTRTSKSLAAPLRALEALRVFDALSCYTNLIFKHSDTKWGENAVNLFFGGGGGGEREVRGRGRIRHCLTLRQLSY